MNGAAREPAAAGIELPLAGFVIDLGSEQLRDAHGHAVELRPQAWAVLRYLALKPGRLVMKSELLEAVWPGLVVTDGSLAQAVSDIRAALNDSEHRVIKTVPKRGYMLVADAAASAPVQRADAPPRTNVPIAIDPLIGREADIATVTQWLDEYRLVTLTGPGGVGKTRLAQAAASARVGAHADGTWWVDLAALSSSEHIGPAIALAANLPLGNGDAGTLLARSLAHRDTLLVLDNCEHLVHAVGAIVQSIVAAAPGVRFIATSQELLRVAGEQAYRLDPLAIPSPGTALAQARKHSAVQLLERRAQAVDRRFALSEETIAAAIDLCRRLDGVPLAIEMAAARLPALGIETVRRLVDEWMLRNASVSAPARQTSLRAALEWSHALLDAREQAVLRRLAVFAGSFGLYAAVHVAAADGVDTAAAVSAIAALVEKSLLQLQRLDPPRYRLLETMRWFAAEQLAAVAEAEATLLRHGRAMTQLADTMERDYWLMSDAAWLDRYKADFDDLQAACDAALARPGAEAVPTLMLALRRFDYLRGTLSTLARRAQAAAALLPSAAPRARALLWDTLMAAGRTGQPRVAAARDSVAAWRQLDDVPSLYRSLCAYAVACAGAGDKVRANRALREAFALERPDWPRRLRLTGAASAADVASHCEAVGVYRKRCFAALALAQAAGAEREALCMRLDLADAAMMAGDLHEAIALGWAIVQETGASWHATSLREALTTLCAALSRKGDVPAAISAARQALPLALRDDRAGPLLDHMALLAALMKQAAPAAKLLGCADAWNTGLQRTRRPSEASSADLAAVSIKAVLGAAECRRLRVEGATLSVAQAGALAEALLAPS